MTAGGISFCIFEQMQLSPDGTTLYLVSPRYNKRMESYYYPFIHARSDGTRIRIATDGAVDRDSQLKAYFHKIDGSIISTVHKVP